MEYLADAATYLIEAVLGFFLVLVILRFLFQLLRVDFRNPICQTIVSITNIPLKFLRGFIPGLFGIDLASVVLIIVVGFLKLALLDLLNNETLNPLYILVKSLADTLQLIHWILFIALIISVIVSWVMPYSHNPIIRLVREMIDSILRPVRRILPTLGVIDFSPIALYIALKLLQILIIAPLHDFAMTLL